MSVLVSRRRALAAAALAALVSAVAAPVLAHDADCPHCRLKVVQDTKEQDNEVALRYGRKRIEYRCVWCALTEAQTPQYAKGDLIILAPGEKKGQPIPITRTGGAWSAPAGTVFGSVAPVDHKVCAVMFRAFGSRAAYDAYAKKHAATLGASAKPLTLTELLALTAPKAR